ncbi:hypothetical protein B4U80_12744 [Leptotrombidium deliense]|uniref:Acetylserotonin O-methyltransferase n=1 Tax=Leptotrombidium deliense TaxID=299467 RepID=A0A443SNS0_9ACAR|nr:hypothetical protein B4U80_12744 [Leptotrombidium deliense]
MYDLVLSYVKPCMIHCAVELDIVDHLSKEAMNASKLAEITNTNADNLHRLLRGLASIGILKADENGNFSVTKFGETLKESDTHSLKNTAKLLLFHNFTTMRNLTHSIKNSGSAFEFTHGKPYYDYLSENAELEDIFAKTMKEQANISCDQITSAYDFSKFRSIVDVGGGHGSFLRRLLISNRNVFGTVFDRDYVIQKCEKSLSDEFGDRCKAISGDFLVSVPDGGDCYLLKHVVLNWTDEKALQILRNIRQRMNADSKLIIIEALVAENNEPETSKLRDIGMMAITGGILRTYEQHTKLLMKAELKLNRLIQIPNCLYDIIEATVL